MYKTIIEENSVILRQNEATPKNFQVENTLIKEIQNFGSETEEHNLKNAMFCFNLQVKNNNSLNLVMEA